MPDFTTLEYLKKGNPRQQLAYDEIKKMKIFEILKAYNPLLVGTIPIEIDLPESDLDIICQCESHTYFSKLLWNTFSHRKGFNIETGLEREIPYTLADFKTDQFTFEIFCQNIPSIEQNAYRHMLVEYQVLKQHDETFRKEILRLKKSGMKTEPAFAKILGLEGNPYYALLKLEDDW